MADIYEIDYDVKAVEWTPPNKRGLLNISFIRTVFMQPIQYVRDLFLGAFRLGYPFPTWSSLATYSKGQKIAFKEVIYESLEDSNTDVPTSAKWRIYLPSFIGVNERIKYNGQKLILEYALNKRFGTSFRQPTLQSDIYITTVPYVVVGFVVAQSETPSSSVGQTTSDDAIGYSYPFSHVTNFSINVPAAVYATISEEEVRQFVDKIIPAGLNYTVSSY